MSDAAVQNFRTAPAEAAPFETGFLNEARLPAVVRPGPASQKGSQAVAALLASAELKALLAQHGAVLFRGWGLDGEAGFAEVVSRHYGADASAYIGGVSPRGAVRDGKIYKSTKVPAHLRIHQHNEMAYLRRAPRDLLFFCDLPSPEGGETPLTDCRQLMREIPEEVRETFKRKGLRNREHFYGRFWNFWTFGMQHHPGPAAPLLAFDLQHPRSRRGAPPLQDARCPPAVALGRQHPPHLPPAADRAPPGHGRGGLVQPVRPRSTSRPTSTAG